MLGRLKSCLLVLLRKKAVVYGAIVSGGIFLYISARFQRSQRLTMAHQFCDVTDTTPAQVREQMQTLLGEHACQAGQASALLDDPWRLLWSPGRTAFLPFFEGRFTVLSWRDPVGPPTEHQALLQQFIEYARVIHKQAVMIGLSEEAALSVKTNRNEMIWIGSELYYDLAEYAPRGKASFNLRHTVNAARRHGAKTREIYPLQNGADRLALQQVEVAWKAANQARKTRSFLRMAPLENATERRYFAVEVASSDGQAPQMVGFLMCSKVSDQGWCMQDLIRTPDAPRGCLEVGILDAMATLKNEGFGFVSMSIVPFYDPTELHSIAHYSSIVQWGIKYFDRFYHFTGLQGFKAKFIPTSSKSIHVLLDPKQVTPMLLFDVVKLFFPTRRIEQRFFLGSMKHEELETSSSTCDLIGSPSNL